MDVEYRRIDGFPNYWVGSDGTVWSCLRWGGSVADTPSGSFRLLKPDVRKYGHQYITIKSGGARSRFQVHHLVLEAFVGSRPDGMEACHKDGDASNNAASNLRWGTHRSNMQDRSRHGTLSGEKHGRAILNSEKAAEIRRRHQAGEKVAPLAREFGISETQGHRVVRGKVWTVEAL